MRAIQKLVRNGNATQVTIPRPMLIALGWLPGNEIVVEQLEDDTLRIRALEDSAFRPAPKARVVIDTPLPVTK